MQAGLTAAEQKFKIVEALKQQFNYKHKIAEWIFENGSGRKVQRDALRYAIDQCKGHNAKLVTANVDRLARSVQTTMKVVEAVVRQWGP